MVKIICEYCDLPFDAEHVHKRKYCSPECRKAGMAQLRDAKAMGMGYSSWGEYVGAKKEGVWTEPEDELLKALANKYHISIIVEIYPIECQKLGYPSRSAEAIKVRHTRLGLKANPPSGCWNMQLLAKALDINVDRVRRWVKEGLETQGCGWDGQMFHLQLILQNELRYFAARHPYLFWGISAQRLGTVLGDRALAKEICANTKQATIGRPIPVVLISAKNHKNAVFRSAKNAATSLDLCKSRILKNLKTETPIYKKMHFVRFDYPVWWVPLECRDEFNQIAGEILHLVYQRLREIEGYTKLSCAVIAGRIAVSAALLAFRRIKRQQLNGVPIDSVEILAQFWQERFVNSLQYHAAVERSEISRARVKNIVHRKVSTLFTSTYKSAANNYFEDFFADFTYYCHCNYFTKNYLPEYYEPRHKIERADIWVYMEGLCNAYCHVGEDRRPLVYLRATRFIQLNPPHSEYNSDWLMHNEYYQDDAMPF